MSAERAERIDPKTRRPLPEGIRFRKDRGKYQVRVWAIGLNGEQRERSTFVETLAEAKKLRAETLTRRYPDGDMTLTQWHSRHWSVIEGSVRASTARAYERGWRLRVKPWLGHVKLEKLTAGVIEEAITGWEGSTSTRIDALSVLSRLLDGAVRAHLVPLNQARLARRPKSESATSLRSRALTAAEVPTLLAAIDDAHYRRYIAALVYTGMRANEATALRMEDVDLSHRTIHVRRAFSIGADGRGVELTPKSHKERDVPIPTPLVAPLTEAMAGKHRGELVFTGPRGGRINASNVRRAIDWKALRSKLHRDDLRLHDLRHTLATMLFDAGASANDVQAVLGHSSMQMTERYSRARSDVAKRAAAAIDSLFGSDPVQAKRSGH
ncbi:site-specific integrase [Microbacterium sp. SORGH_AS_0888]|uniref:tyrosine-type recombinase/integrase n=1 Tax=Microbacterium sp. SORGH_AS_0888 TaxID=3041791 RepID=UPI002781854B|nr:site-specific integrase [Microbacterium sp. SORGH_AS_0888]MDQ1129941.1 integrase [Microbacterium sp. SORGH_AS_0888]